MGGGLKTTLIPESSLQVATITFLSLSRSRINGVLCFVPFKFVLVLCGGSRQS